MHHLRQRFPTLPNARHLVMFCVLFGASMTGNAGELMPFEIPEEEVKWDQIELDQFKVDPSLPVASEEPAEAKDPGPDWPAPAIDAYFDIAFSDANFSGLGYADTPGGYRFIAGFLFQGLGGQHWRIAPEFGYSRIGLGKRKQSSVITDDPRWDIVTTDNFQTDVSALDFGGRFALGVGKRLEAYLRGGLNVYHVSNKKQRTLDFIQKNSPAPPRDIQRPASTTEANADIYAGAGISFKLGSVPSIYAEYSARKINGEIIDVRLIGLLLNF